VSHTPIVDVHVHVLPPSGADEVAERDPYEIWEYGSHDVEVCELAGTIGQVTAAMHAARCDHFVLVNMFVPDNELAKIAAESSHDVGTATFADYREELAGRLVAFNTWALELAAARSDLTTFVAMDPKVLGNRAGADHLRWAHEQGALGIKIHPVAQRFLPDDPRMQEIFGVCEELGLGVIAHAGASKSGLEWAEPDAYAAVLDAHPRLKLVLAHLGGGRWQQTQRLADAYPALRFDLCEIIAWAGAPGAPTHDELGRMIKAIGPQRVMFGTDFPWYQVDRTIDQVMGLPHLAEEEREGILGPNAVTYLGLPVAV
jgi:hypothetical protein